jgi:hypothetical protein
LRNSFNLGLRVSLRLRYGCQAVALGLLLALDLGPLVGLALRLGVELVLRCLLLGRYAGVVASMIPARAAREDRSQSV